jgi:hypothetical protein
MEVYAALIIYLEVGVAHLGNEGICSDDIESEEGVAHFGNEGICR